MANLSRHNAYGTLLSPTDRGITLSPLTPFTPVLLALLLGGLFFLYRLKLSDDKSHKSQALKVAIPEARVGNGYFTSMNAYNSNPVVFLRESRSTHGKQFKIPSPMADTYFLMTKQMNRFYLEMKEDVWSFGDGMGIFLKKVVLPGYFDHLSTLVSSVNRGINRPAALRTWADNVADEAVKCFDSWSDKEDIDLFEASSELVQRVLVRCMMGTDFYEEHLDELIKHLHDMEKDIGHPFNFLLPAWVPHPPARRLRAARDAMCAIFDKCLAKRRSQPASIWDDSLDYVNFTLKDKATQPLEKYFASHHTLIMFAAHTSTVASVAWTIVELLRHPEELAKLQADLQGQNESLPWSSRWTQQPQLGSCLRESSRFYSGVSMLRLARTGQTLPDGSYVPAGSVVSISPYLTHRDEDIYPNAEEWKPERWRRDPDLPRQLNSGDQAAVLGFGFGTHRCPGEKMATMIATTAIGVLFSQYSVRVTDTSPVPQAGDRPETLDFTKIGSAWAKKPFKLHISART
ncbi:hypothetical protein CF319_g5480 [Tilletia indica]|uniref:Cytochrome P450 n=2 Tax=Tilletia TaxID=13289 RepID=A0A8X7N7Z3_9BASI|nr:hypothetical protein CF327_g3810 [Tilletia walkeri]KAE8221103.1 hypothetical protein CF319_g5480 [Tilletia indica]KAE8228574.1 hypothetical protein CF326_g6488 [Tilletia indica]KAE8258758.1 hypothetical protein A4X13_0g1465 [Tilletia indica]KAE8268816.1 hypothetical protein A4X09_0g3522 [Tilletia walkeri]